MEILLIVRFCCNCTYGNPGPLSREVVCLPTSGGWLEWAEMWPSRFGGQQGREGGQVAGPMLTPCRPASSLELESGGRSGQGGLGNGRTRLEGSRYPRGSVGSWWLSFRGWGQLPGEAVTERK